MKISRDNPCLYLTCVCNDRLPVFRTDKLKQVVAKALDEARRSGGFLILAYVIMPDHLHLITDSALSIENTLRFVNGITARRVIGYLKENGHLASLEKLRKEEGRKGYRHSLWDHHANALPLTNEEIFLQKVNYIHKNPVRAGLVDNPDDYLYSSSRIWHRRAIDHEPLWVDLDKIDWKKSGGNRYR